MPFDASPDRTKTVTDCVLCPIQDCLGRGSVAATTAWSDILSPRVALMPGAPPLMMAGDKLSCLYSVRAGCVKTYTVDADGQERIRGFHLPGDLIGLDALDRGFCRSSAVAVVPSQVCVAPMGDLRRMLRIQPDLAQRMMELASRELSLALAIAGEFTADQRLAAFLLYMEQRLGARGGVLRLPMPQRDVGNYLRLATETVCRTIKHFVAEGWLIQEGRGLRLANRSRLHEMAEPVGMAQPVKLAHLARAA